MKFDTQTQQKLLKAQRDSQKASKDLYLAKAKHRSMKRVFRGIMSYPQRKILFNVGQHNMKKKSN